MKKIADESITQECQVIYDILLEEKTSYIDDMEKQLKNEELQEAQKGVCSIICWRCSTAI